MKAELGTVISGTLRPEDLIPAFADELRFLWEASVNHDPGLWEEIACLLEAADSADYESESVVELVWELADALNEFAPEGAYFGAHPGDGADFGPGPPPGAPPGTPRRPGPPRTAPEVPRARISTHSWKSASRVR